MTLSRPPAVASRRARARRRAAAASPARGSRVPVTARGGVFVPKTSRAALSALPRTAFSCSRFSAAPGGKGGGGVKSALTAASISSMASRIASRRSERLDLDGGGRGGVGVDAEDAAPAAGEPGHGPHVAVGGPVDLAPGGAEPGEAVRADDGLDLGGDRLGLAGLEDSGVLAGQQEGGGEAGLAGRAGVRAGGGEVVEDEARWRWRAASGGRRGGGWPGGPRCGTLPARWRPCTSWPAAASGGSRWCGRRGRTRGSGLPR